MLWYLVSSREINRSNLNITKVKISVVTFKSKGFTHTHTHTHTRTDRRTDGRTDRH